MKRPLDEAVATLPKPRGPALHSLTLTMCREDYDALIAAIRHAREGDGCTGPHDGSLCRGRAAGAVGRAYLARVRGDG